MPPGWAASTCSAVHDASSTPSRASRPIIGSTGTPTSSASSAQRVRAAVIGPSPPRPDSEPARSALLSTASSGCRAAAIASASSGLITSAVTYTTTSTSLPVARADGCSVIPGADTRPRAHATVSRPTPRRPRTATRSGAAARAAIAATRASAWPAANSGSSSTKIWCPCPFMPGLPSRRALPPPDTEPSPKPALFAGQGPGFHRMVAPVSPRCEPLFINYQLKATVGYQSGPGADTSGVNAPRWTNARATRGRDTFRHAGGGGRRPGEWRSRDDAGSARFERARIWLPPGHQFSFAALSPVRSAAPDLGAALARAGHLGDPPALHASGHRCLVRPQGSGGARDRLRQWHVDAGHGAGRADDRRDRGRGVPARPRPAAVLDRP